MEWDKVSLEQQIPGEQWNENAQLDEEVRATMDPAKEFRPLTLREELARLLKMYHKAKADQMGITMGLMDIHAEVALLYKERGLQVPAEIKEFFQP